MIHRAWLIIRLYPTKFLIGYLRLIFFIAFIDRYNIHINMLYLVVMKYIDQPLWVFGDGLGYYHQASRCVMQQWSPNFCHWIHKCQRSLEHTSMFGITVREPVPLPVQSVENDAMRKSHTCNINYYAFRVDFFSVGKTI